MFTGIIQDIGTATNITKKQDVATFTIESKKITPMLNIGDSISIDGTCLTVVKKKHEEFEVEAIPETINKTISKNYTIGKQVNLEPSMQISDRFHGHMVTGHIDFIGLISRIDSEEETIAFAIQFPKEYSKYFAMKGSVTINGVSLTISKLNADNFEVQIIPHTQKSTNLNRTNFPKIEKKGEINIEIDIIARYLESLLNEKEGESNYFFLHERGFI
jgi:riboflavin synthase